MPDGSKASPESTRVVSAETLRALTDALRLHLSTQCPDGVLRRALGQFSREARANGARAEQVLIELHRVGDALVEATSAGSRADRQRLLARAVSLCIEEYYADA
jgi:hypothetical protein